MKIKITKNFGFTLIELLVVIVIIGILSTISTATFKSYFGRARDTSRIAAVNQISTMIRVDAAYDWTDGRFKYNLTEGDAKNLSDMLEGNDYKMPRGEKGLCFAVGMGHGDDADIGDDDEFVVLAWSEGEENVIADGTKSSVDAAKAAGFTEGNFKCSAILTDVGGNSDLQTALGNGGGEGAVKFIASDSAGGLVEGS